MLVKFGYTDEGGLPPSHPLYNTDIKFEIDASVSPYYPATYDSPAEGGEIEINEARALDGYTKYSEEKEEWIEQPKMKEEESKALGEKFLELVDRDSKLRDELDEKIYKYSEDSYYDNYE